MLTSFYKELFFPIVIKKCLFLQYKNRRNTIMKFLINELSTKVNINAIWRVCNRCDAYKMGTNIKISFLILLILTIIGCSKSDKKEKQLIKIEFGNLDSKNDSLGVELELNRFKNWKELIDRTERISCNDSLPKITIKSGNIIKTIYFQNPCWKDVGCILIKQRNVIEIHNDTINKSDMNFYPLDSLQGVIKRDIENNGKDPDLCDNPEKLLFFVTFDNYQIEHLSKTLDILTESYSRITNKTDIIIWLNDKIPPPPPPKELNDIE
jgi:hypothetical protein